MHIAIDTFGGDHAPLAILQGALLAAKEMKVDITLVGDRETIAALAKKHDLSLSSMQILHAATVIRAEDAAKSILREHADSSMAAALRLVKENKADAVVSAGPTGAYLMGATVMVGRIRGIKRPAIGTVIPGKSTPVFLIDCGANAETRPEMLCQFARMGSIYMNRMFAVENPRVSLANNGTEEGKGTPLQLEAYRLLQNEPIRFVGNIEGRDLFSGVADVVVADGFTGNIILKTIEGTAAMTFDMLRQAINANVRSKMGALLLKPSLLQLKKRFDYSEYGGAPIIGLQKPVIKAHGSSNATAIKNAIKQAVHWAEAGVTEAIAASVQSEEGEE